MRFSAGIDFNFELDLLCPLVGFARSKQLSLKNDRFKAQIKRQPEPKLNFKREKKGISCLNFRALKWAESGSELSSVVLNLVSSSCCCCCCCSGHQSRGRDKSCAANKAGRMKSEKCLLENNMNNRHSNGFKSAPVI